VSNLHTSSFDNLPDAGYMRQAQIIPDVIPVSSATWWRGVKSGRYPKPVKLSERVTAWKVGDIRQLLTTQAGTGVA
jgi:predicted DNA-binding transcriptional regulator AlpA